MKQQFIPKQFTPATLEVIERANAIVAEYAGMALTLRQLYYQFVSRGWLPNQQRQYKRLGSIVSDGRLAGLIDWSAIEDRGRNLEKPATWDSPHSILCAAANSFQVDLWKGQENRLEVWVEKEALAGVMERACAKYRVPFFSCKGYTSQSELYQAGRRVQAWRRAGVEPVILHLGDHDPSGLDMTRDNRDRLSMFSSWNRVEVRRLALNWDQIEEHAPPPNPAKVTDSRFEDYQAEHGDESWELDALEPRVLINLVESECEGFIDFGLWHAQEELEQEHRGRLWDMANEFLGDEEE